MELAASVFSRKYIDRALGRRGWPGRVVEHDARQALLQHLLVEPLGGDASRSDLAFGLHLERGPEGTPPGGRGPVAG